MREELTWRLSAFIVFLALLSLIVLVSLSPDFGQLPFRFLIAPATVLFLLVFAYEHRGKTALITLLILVAFLAASLYGIHRPFEIRAWGRWLAHGDEYRSLVLGQMSPLDGSLRHIEWDGSGFAGVANNMVYLTYDPQDSLKAEMSTHSAGKFKGVPCEVYQVLRLSSHWYSVQPYTDTTWDDCPQQKR